MSKASLEGMSPEQIESMASIYSDLLQNPETRMATLAATKRVNPKLSIPEVDVRSAVAAEFKTRDERLAAAETAAIKRDAEQNIRDQRAALRDKGYSAQQVAAIEKLMMDKGIASYDVAAEFHDAQNRAAEPTPETGRAEGRGNPYKLPESPLAALKGGKKGLAAWGREQANAALDDLRAGRVKLH